MTLHYSSQGIAYICVEWFLNFCEISIVALRLYSRTLLTRSLGSDDFAIIIGCILDVVGGVIDLEAFKNGWAEHDSNLSVGEYSSEQKWEYISIITGYLSFFFIRASVLLFVLRLLPSYKKRQQQVVYAIFFVNFAITLAACVMFGVSCIPFKASWDAIPDAKCFSEDRLVIVNQVNASLACVCDVITALIPQFLLWNVQMKPKTKRQLNFLFSLGLITGVLSIGRAATTTQHSLTEDSTWNEIPNYFFFDFEAQLGIIFACGPALRQFYSYYHRTRSCLPTSRRQYPNEDFEKMRWRINLRDIFWFRQAPMTGNRVFDAAPIFRAKTNPPPVPSARDPKSTEKVKTSVLDVWEKRIRNMFTMNRSQLSTPSPTAAGLYSSSVERLAKTNNGGTPGSGDTSDSSNPTTLVASANRDAVLDLGSTANAPSSPSYDHELATELENPRTRPIYETRRI